MILLLASWFVIAGVPALPCPPVQDVEWDQPQSEITDEPTWTHEPAPTKPGTALLLQRQGQGDHGVTSAEGHLQSLWGHKERGLEFKEPCFIT